MNNTSDIIQSSGILFGTSGARGLVTQFTPDACAAFAHAFIASIENKFNFTHVAIAIDNRPSSQAMAQACIQAIRARGLEAIYYGVVPTPALAYTAMQDNIPCIMVTGSHIPFDRNGLKFYRPDGEISKADEQAILSATAEFDAISELPELEVNTKAATAYIERYTSLFERLLLEGKRIGIYEHSSAGRDLYADMFTALGAEVIALERSDEFVPIDTEAVSDADKLKAKKWSEQYHLDFIFSTDGDGDRPLVADENGDWLRGDVLGLLCANEMKIEALAVPVSCNTAIESCELFSHVTRTKIGSPYVIAEFEQLAKDFHSVAGFEANGGFLLGSDVEVNQNVVKALPTRDAVLPALMLLAASREKSISELVNSLPQRMTHSDRIQNFATEKSLAILAIAKEQPEDFLIQLGFSDSAVASIDITDGLRMTLTNGDIIHFRPSGNAPELRCYAESDSMVQAQYLVNYALKQVQLVKITD
ncbi:phosphomannomutase [Photobacterium lipolyticum]|uniref:Phosphomannomutase n=1 Tax=Photobacterium lipolyticum TaxID=266810 RepID=A0A2T3MVA5_9GAMM|nr:phosphomannomutase [Photobacterium lipolyticum]PSW03869.1 phosphomannomutase [Photobacterium lipolyticum]